MSDLSKITKDELAVARDAAQEEVERWKAADARRDVDARAIDACAKALDALLTETARRSSSTTISNYNLSSGYSHPGPKAPVERVLGYLQQRYGVADATGERDALRAELERTQRELETLRRRFSTVYEAVQG